MQIQSRTTLNVCLTLLIAALFLFITPGEKVQAQDEAGSNGGHIQVIVDGVNQARINNGLPPLQLHPLLNQAAQAHVDDLIAHGMYGHYGSDGSNVHTRVRRTGYSSGWVSENWVTSATPQQAMSWWMNDWIHRVNILNANWDEFGVGAAPVGNGFWIYVTDFANSDGQASAVAAPAPAAFVEPAPKLTVPAGGMDYTIRGGDTLLGIAIRYGLDWQDIAVTNNLGEDDLLQIGQTLRLPGIAGVGGGSAPADGGMLYTVDSGDTLVTIAARHNIAWEDVAAANGLGEYSILQIGMQLRLPGVEEEKVEEDQTEENIEADIADASNAQSDSKKIDAIALDSQKSASLEPNTESAVEAPALSGDSSFVENRPSAIQYTVKSGDTLFSVASRNGLTWEQLAEFNQLSENSLLQIGQTLSIPGKDSPDNFASAKAPAASVTPSPARIYTVRSGDTIVGIALRLGLDWQELLRINGLDESSILSLGQTLRLE